MANLTNELAETMANIGVNSAYGAPIEIDGTTIIPVAFTSFGFGAGEGGTGDTSREYDGSGGGGGGVSVPIGSYVTRDGVTRFEPNKIVLLAVGIPFTFVAGRALARVVKALKR